MKKVLLTLTFAAFAFAANAQFVVGGQLGFNSTGGTDNYPQSSVNPTAVNIPNTGVNTLIISPYVGYFLNEKTEVGLGVDYGMSSIKTYSATAYAAEKERWSTVTSSSFEVFTYVDYFFATFGKFRFFVEADLSYGWTPRDKTHTFSNVTGSDVTVDTKGTTQTSWLELGLYPGVNYRINEHFSVDCYIDLASLTFLHSDTKTYGSATDPDELIDTDHANSFIFGVNSSSQSLNNHLNNFSIGFNYHF